ncbi:uncharacterized protein LOC134527260 [Bacillus rossius redtenbacheri]|uniref:uncharacterized protein LOC134527260 n=1 Tax=Bacillus rossius redtenbacheri TaxID=93214 RepID=UPI002FDD25DC
MDIPEEEVSGAMSVPPLTKSELADLLGPDFTVESLKSERLTQAGDNYFSNMQAVEVKLLPHRRKLHLVAKLPPVSSFVIGISHFGDTLRKEKIMYLEVAKVFQDIQIESNVPVRELVDLFPKCYGAHVSYVDNMPVAEKSALILEDLRPLGYRCADRIKGLDLAHTYLVVSRLARLHATAIAVKIKKPLVFKNVILHACENFMTEGPPHDEKKKDKMEDKLFEQLASIEEIKPYLDCLKKSNALKPYFFPLPIEPFASIKHSDFCTNNILFKYTTDSYESLPTDVKFIDFQMTQYDSPVRDLIFLLYSSTDNGLVPDNYDHFIQLYHEHFIDALMKLGCDIKPFSYDVL